MIKVGDIHHDTIGKYRRGCFLSNQRAIIPTTTTLIIVTTIPAPLLYHRRLQRV